VFRGSRPGSTSIDIHSVPERVVRPGLIFRFASRFGFNLRRPRIHFSFVVPSDSILLVSLALGFFVLVFPCAFRSRSDFAGRRSVRTHRIFVALGLASRSRYYCPHRFFPGSLPARGRRALTSHPREMLWSLRISAAARQPGAYRAGRDSSGAPARFWLRWVKPRFWCFSLDFFASVLAFSSHQPNCRFPFSIRRAELCR
jgi:hypothetical protein